MISAMFYCKPLILSYWDQCIVKLLLYSLWFIILKAFVIDKQQLSVTEEQVFSLDTFKGQASNYQW